MLGSLGLRGRLDHTTGQLREQPTGPAQVLRPETLDGLLERLLVQKPRDLLADLVQAAPLTRCQSDVGDASDSHSPFNDEPASMLPVMGVLRGPEGPIGHPDQTHFIGQNPSTVPTQPSG